MTAEFITRISEGKLELPDSLLDSFTGEVHVLLSKSEKTDEPDLIEQMLQKPLHVAGFKPLTREEIYDRDTECAQTVSWK